MAFVYKYDENNNIIDIIDDEYLIETIEYNAVNYLDNPYPISLYYIDDNNDITYMYIPTIPISLLNAPYPCNLWYMDNNDIKIDGNLDYPSNYLKSIYPIGLWYVDIDLNTITRNNITLGAMSNNKTLTNIIIDKSVTYLGENVFTNSNIKSVTISRDCKYYDTTFPNDCVINYY